MDGHEIIEIPFKKLITIIDYRIEPEYFSKRFIGNENLLLGKSYKIFNQIATVYNGRAYSSDSFSSAGEIYISKIGDVTNKREVAAWDKVTKQEFLIQKGSLLSDGDILMTLTGDPPDVGKTNIVITYEKLCTWNQRVAKVERLGDDFISNYALYPVLSSEICRMQMERFAKGIRQRNLGNDCFSFVMVPILGADLQKILSQIVEKHISMLKSADYLYLEAENLMLTALNMANFVPSDKATSIKTFSESFDNVGRLDAEYYQSKYDELFEVLENFTTKNLGGETGLACIKKSIEPGSDAYQETGIPFVRISDVDKFGISQTTIRLSHDVVPNIENLYLKKNTILLSKDGSVGLAYKVDEDMQVVTSGAFLHLIVKDPSTILPDYLTLVLNSQIVQMQAERDCNGAIIQHWKPSEIEKVIIPILDMNKQKEIADKVQESFRLRKEAKQLLSNAVKAVEMAIEIDEDSAMLWLLAKGVDY